MEITENQSLFTGLTMEESAAIAGGLMVLRAKYDSQTKSFKVETKR